MMLSLPRTAGRLDAPIRCARPSQFQSCRTCYLRTALVGRSSFKTVSSFRVSRFKSPGAAPTLSPKAGEKDGAPARCGTLFLRRLLSLNLETRNCLLNDDQRMLLRHHCADGNCFHTRVLELCEELIGIAPGG